MNNITVIIPVHEYDDKIAEFFNKSILSVTNQIKLDEASKIIVISPPNVHSEFENYIGPDNSRIKFLVNEGKTDYQSQVNLAIKDVDTKYFTVLEFDDEFAITYLSNGEKYIECYPNIDIFMPMIIEVTEKNEAIKLTNESVWSQQFVGENGELGYLNLNSLKQYTDFKLSGAIIKKETFLDIGGYKSNIKLTFMYELLLRALNNACKAYTIPKLGYKHLATRENSLFDDYQKNLSMPERKFWFETATKECNFMNDRIIDTSKLNKVVVEEK